MVSIQQIESNQVQITSTLIVTNPMRNTPSMQTCLDNLCDYIVHKQNWELLRSPSQIHVKAMFKNLKTGKIYEMVQLSSSTHEQLMKDFRNKQDLPAIFLEVRQVSDDYFLIEKACRSLPILNFNVAMFTEEEIKNTLAPIFKSLLERSFPFDYQIKKQNIVIDDSGKIRLIHPVCSKLNSISKLDSCLKLNSCSKLQLNICSKFNSSSEPNNLFSFRYLLQYLVLLFSFGEEIQEQLIEGFAQEDGMMKLTKKMIRKGFSDSFIIFLITLLRAELQNRLISICLNLLEGDEGALDDQNLRIVLEWVRKIRVVCCEEQQQSIQEKIKKIGEPLDSQAEDLKNNYKRYLIQMEMTAVKKRRPHGAKYRNGQRIDFKRVQDSEGEDDSSHRSFSLTKTQFTEGDSAHNPEDISM